MLCFRPGGLRYKRLKHVICATMPWAIWPALVTLWGVCWMFHGPWSPLFTNTNFDEVADPRFHDADDFLVDPLLNLDLEVNFDFSPPSQHSLDNNEVGQEETQTFRAMFATIGDGGVHAQEIVNPVTSNHQQHGETSSLLPSSVHHMVAIGNSLSASTITQQTSQTNASTQCMEPACHSTFRTDRELRRHQQTIHSGSQFACIVIGCKRGSQKPFNRHDNLQRHMQRVHGQASLIRPASAPESSPRRENLQTDNILPPTPMPGNRRSGLENALAQTNTDGTSEPGPEQSEEVARLQRQLEDAVAKRQWWEEEIRSLEEEIEIRKKLDACVRKRLAR